MTRNLVLREVFINKLDGSQEKVLIADNDLPDKFSWRDHVPIIYAGVGVIALLLTIYTTITHLKK